MLRCMGVQSLSISLGGCLRDLPSTTGEHMQPLQHGKSKDTDKETVPLVRKDLNHPFLIHIYMAIFIALHCSIFSAAAQLYLGDAELVKESSLQLKAAGTKAVRLHVP